MSSMIPSVRTGKDPISGTVRAEDERYENAILKISGNIPLAVTATALLFLLLYLLFLLPILFTSLLLAVIVFFTLSCSDYRTLYCCDFQAVVLRTYVFIPLRPSM